MATRPGTSLTRRRFLGASAAAAGSLALPSPLARGPFAQTAAGSRPGVPYGVQSGEVGPHEGVVWSATDRPARMLVEYATTDAFTDVRRVTGPAALPETGYAAKVALVDLPAGQPIFYRVTFQDLGDLRALSAPVTGRFKTVPADYRDVSFVWSGDTAGQGWGINAEWGGMKLYEVMRRTEPDFFVHSGDMIYADGPIAAEVRLPSGRVWKNLVTEEKAKVAETLEEFRGNYKYNLLDAHVRRFNGEVAQYVQWDDHEVTNNWFTERILEDARYTVKSCALLAARAKRAMFEFTPLVGHPIDSERVYRAVRRGPLLDVFMLDMRSYRGANGENRQATLDDEARILGRAQAAWLKRELLASRATWKVIAADMPLGLVVRHDAARGWGSEAVAQGDGPPLGRELEIADLLRFIKLQRDPERGLDHCRRPLLRHPSLRAGARAVPGLRALLRVRLGAAPRRRLRAQRTGQYLRPPGRLHAESRWAPEHAAHRGGSLLRPRPHRRPYARDDGDPSRSDRRRAAPAGAARGGIGSSVSDRGGGGPRRSARREAPGTEGRGVRRRRPARSGRRAG